MKIPRSVGGVVEWCVVRLSVRWAFGIVLAATLVVVLETGNAQAQQLYINEVIAENNAEAPADIGDGHPDMIELYNAGPEDVVLGAAPVNLAQAYALGDRETFDATRAWHFPVFGLDATPVVIPAGGFVVVFCDANDIEKDCELHASFRINNNASEPITLFGPEDTDGNRAIIDQVWLPPLRNNHSFGRVPDGAGPAPVPLEETLDVFQHFLPGNTSFGECVEQPELPCTGRRVRRLCGGMPNHSVGDNIEPRVDRESHSTSTPAAGEAIDVIARVEDNDLPTPANIDKVQIRYTVDGVTQPPIDMIYDSDEGVLDGSVPPAPEPGQLPRPPRPLHLWSLWHGSLPGLPAGARVVFDLYVEDQEGLASMSPRRRCPDGVGPCNNVGLPGPGCVIEAGCVPTSLRGCHFDSCDNRREFLVGYAPSSRLQGVVINEVVPSQTDILKDPSQNCEVPAECLAATSPPTCPTPNPTCGFEDFIELTNTSSEPVDLSGLWLSDRPFHPQGWQFPAGSEIDPGEYLIVWTDNDGGKCPREADDLPGDGQECPDPTQPALKRFHTNFNLQGGGDQVLLFEETAQGFGVVHSLSWGHVAQNVSVSLSPDGSRDGSIVFIPRGSPAEPNVFEDLALFKRGDANQDCTIDISDAIFFLTATFVTGEQMLCPDAADADDTGVLEVTDAIFLLGFQFGGGAAEPPAPGPLNFGLDPTADDLESCAIGTCP